MNSEFFGRLDLIEKEKGSQSVYAERVEAL
jgi:hypothetical protein